MMDDMNSTTKNIITTHVLEPPFPAQYSLSSSDSELQSHLLDSSLALLPGDIIIPTTSLPHHLHKELSINRLNDIHKHLWLAGRPGNTHSLHQQKMMGREIFTTEQTDLHLVWQHNSIYVKPLPAFLLDHSFFRKHICLPSSSTISPRSKTLYGAACGLLYSYTNLIHHESDFHLATSLHLLPSELTWRQWSLLSAHLRLSLPPCSPDINKRYIYGELRLSRLNQIMRFLAPPAQRSFVRGYHATDKQYGTFFSRNFGWLVLVFAYLSVILSAMQVGQVQGVKAFDDASWGFAVAVIVAVCATLGIMVAMFVGLLLWHLVATLTKHKEKSVEDWERGQEGELKEDCSDFREKAKWRRKLGLDEV